LRASLYRIYRPRLFAEIVGQDAAIDVLRSSFAERCLAHAYLFSGPRGCGKTTAARLLAKVVNCKNPTEDGEPCCECDSCRAIPSGEHMDVMEIDGASNRGIDQIRELKSHVGLASFMGGTKVYILDEVHMLTMEAFNALLKTLEEPPPSVMFIFATTEPHKVPATIRSRCQHILFHGITTELVAEQLRRIASAEDVTADDSALWEIARGADGALRDAISLFEQAVAVGRGALTADSVLALFGGGRAEMERWIVRIREHPDDAAASLKRTLELGVSGERFLDGLFPLLRDMWTFGLWGEKSFAGTSLSDSEKDFLRKEAPNWDVAVLRRAAKTVASLFPRVRLGLRNDVFSGLLMFELLGAFDPPEQAGAENAHSAGIRRPVQSCQVSVPETERARPLAVKPALPAMPNALLFQEPSGGDDARPALKGKSGEIMSRLMKDDLPLAAALLDVRIFRSGDSLEFDFSEASPSAVVMLSGARAASCIERVFGMAPETPPVEEGSRGAEKKTESRIQSPASAISARLGADILMSKRLDSDEMDIEGDEEDERF
jgi:DNA polymerase-3 subunit gamma/tau